MVLVGAFGYGSYIYGSKNSKNNAPLGQANTGAGTNKEDNQLNQTKDTTLTSYHTVGFGSLDRDPNILTKLAFPQNYQAIAFYNGPDSFRSLFGDDKGSFTYHGGNWKIGNPEDGVGQVWGDIGIMGIAYDWYTRNGFASYGGSNGDSFALYPENTTLNGYDFSTPVQKKASLNKLISDTTACGKDSTKGFSISGVFNVCYKPYLIRQAVGSYSPKLHINGYASIKNVPYVMLGWVDVSGGLDGYDEDAMTKAGDDFIAGKIPSPTQKNIDLFVEAFKQSSVTTK